MPFFHLKESFLARLVLLLGGTLILFDVAATDDVCPVGVAYNEICWDSSIESCGEEELEATLPIRCDTAQNLESILADGISAVRIYRCRCKKPYKYNEDLNKCQAPFGHPCVANVGSSCVRSTLCRPSEDAPEEYRCVCKERLIPGEDGHCYFEYGQDCNTAYATVNPCSPSNKYIVCEWGWTRGRCACAHPSLYYDETQKRCIARIGDECGSWTSREEGPGCGTNGIWCNTVSNPAKCECMSSATGPDDERENCLRTIFSACNETAICGPRLFCDQDQLCKCPSDYIRGGFRKENCKVPAGKNCSKDADCVKFSKCIDSTCKCDSIFTAAQSGECFLNRERDCDAEANMCDEYGHYTCEHWLQGTTQTDGRCRCKEGYFSNPDGRCQGLLMSYCRKDVEELLLQFKVQFSE